MNERLNNLRHQSGVMLLEALIAILIFSVGILALVGLQAAAVKQSTDARYRSEAALLASELFGQMWVSDRTVASLQNNFNTGNTAYNAWLARVSATLPGVVVNTITAPNVAVDAQGITTIELFWIAPNEPAGAAPHRYITISQIR